MDADGAFGSGHAMLVIGDEWGVVHHVAHAGEGHGLPPREEWRAVR